MAQLHVVETSRTLFLAARKAQEPTFEHLTFPYQLAIPFLFLIGAYVQAKKAIYRFFGGRTCVPTTNFWLVDWISINSRRVRDGAAKWLALDAVYNFRQGEGANWIVRAFDNYWMHIRNAQAVRNRLIIVKRELAGAILKVSKTKTGGEPVRVLSLAAGSGQGVIEVLADMRRAGVHCEVMLVDQDGTALAHARKLAKQHGVSDMITTREGNVIAFKRELHGSRPDIIEMCGLMDYLEDNLAIALIKRIYHYLQPDGFFLTCHIHPNAEAYFLWHVVNWGMLYRTRKQLRDLLIAGEFLDPKLFTEPHRIHSVAVAQKV
ncbi:MAG TPA: class I SAM-dependent methyltransferase family protein [Candidatus Paceibacterota bacterium]|nr:class I SAM-dependent methyltransferase family protein [Candidatus Paceibacterota bacterium]